VTDVPLTIRQHLLVRAALPAVERHARHVIWRWPGLVDADDLRSVGKLALYDAVTRFDETLEVPFDDFASMRVYGAMLDTVRRESRDVRRRLTIERETVRFLETYDDDYNILHHDDDELHRRLDTFKGSVLAVAFAAALEEALAEANEDAVDEQEDLARAMTKLGEAVAQLDRRDQGVLKWLVVDRLDLQGIAEKLGSRHKTTAWRRVQLVLKRLREYLLGQGITRAPRPRSIDPERPGARMQDWLPPDLALTRPAGTSGSRSTAP
jgi:RNA polymerase sigma factor (sigma-70 family)